MSRVLFLDDGGVLSDNERRGAQWRALLAPYLARELGGAPEAWSLANVAAVERAWARYVALGNAGAPLAEMAREYALLWLREMAERVGVPTPPDEHALALVRRVNAHVTERVRAFHSDVVPALRALRDRGVVVHTASGAFEADLDGYARAERARDLLHTLYGVDIVDRWKAGPSYYEAIFAHAGVAPRDALVVDDSTEAVSWARDAGATAMLMDRTGRARGALRSLDELL